MTKVERNDPQRRGDGENGTYGEMRSRVLLVDDQSSVRDALYTHLESAGYEVLAGKDGQDGLNICRQSSRPIDLLVTDYNMPGMSGLELARKCLQLCSELAVLYVSGSSPDEELALDLQERQRAFLAKPFRRDDLLRKARELLPNRIHQTIVPGC
jgi:CheY-like chemotaxis protein